MSRSTTSLSVSRPLPAPRSLSGELVARLTDDITSGKIPPGSRLPTEQELIAATGVSRTVVREAVAALRADGLVVTRQGVGAFVPENARRPLRVRFRPVVVDARRARRDGIAHRHRDRGRRLGRRARLGVAGSQDRRLPRGHRSPRSSAARTRSIRTLRFIAASPTPPATRNSGAFWSISAASSSRVRPFAAGPGLPKRAYSETFQQEHRDIVQAIRSGAVAQARAAMRRHLLNSRKRYQRFAGASSAMRVTPRKVGWLSMHANSSRHWRGGRHRHAAAQAAQGHLSEHPPERPRAAGRPRGATRRFVKADLA